MSYLTIYNWAREFPTKTALVYNGDGISYAAFASAIADTLSHLESEALPAGNTVVVRIRSLADCWVAVLALQELGLHTVCVKSASVIKSLSLGKIVGIVTTEAEFGLDPAEAEDTDGARVVLIPNPDYGKGQPPRSSSHPKDVKGVGGHILYTSGTTGNYKKVFLDAELQEQRNAERIEAYTHCKAETVYNCTGFGLWTGVGYKRPLYVWQLGGCTVLEQRPEWFRYFLRDDMTNSILIPEQVNVLLRFLEHEPPARPKRDFYLLVASGFISNQSAQQLLERVSGYLENIYGSTEINVPILRSIVKEPDDLHWMTPSGYREVEIVDKQGDVCPTDVEGELRVRYTGLDSCSYVDDPQTSERMFRSGYFYPGDMAIKRADGRIRILGRSEDVINVQGQKYSVVPFENKVQRHLGIESVCVFSGLTSEGEDELLIAIESDTWPEKSELKSLAMEFPQFGQVRFALITKLPRTQTGTSKIDRVALRKQLFPAG